MCLVGKGQTDTEGWRVGETQSAWHPTRYEPCVIFYKLITALVMVRMKGGEAIHFKEKHIQDMLAKQAGENQGAISMYQALHRKNLYFQPQRHLLS